MEKYTVKHNHDNDTVTITNTRNNTSKKFPRKAFIFGQWAYNEKTDVYPNYVHELVWEKSWV